MRIEDTPKDATAAIVKLVALIVFGLFLIFAFFGSFYIVNAGERAILITLGNPQETPYKEGLHLKVPFIQSVVIVDIKTQKYEAKASAASKDLQVVSTDIAVNYRLTGESVVLLYKEIGLGYADKIIQPAVQEVVKASTAEFSAEELITKRDNVKQKIDIALADRLKGRGITMETTSITNFDFSAEFNRAIEAKVTQEQQALTAKNKLAQIEYEAQQVKAAAIGQRDAAIAQAEGQANATLVTAIADARKVELMQQQLSKSTEYVEYIKAQRWNGVLPTTMFGTATPLVQFPLNNGNSTG